MVNELGFHGSMNPSRLMEKELFDSSEHVTEGINFDTVRSGISNDL
jgi:singapore isolate B (sub-type 7) whole genome shotgun sequence assembly, scaffold_13